MPQRKVRSFCASAQLRMQRDDGGASPKIVGYAAVFNTPTVIRSWFGEFTESIDPHAFDDTLKRGDEVTALFNHDANLVLGRTPKTLTLSADEHGLRCEIIPPDTSMARDLVQLLERGDISQMSFGFRLEDEQDYRVEHPEEAEMPHVTILRASLFDVSVVTFPAYPETEVEAQRSRECYSEILSGVILKRNPSAEQQHRARSISLMRSKLSL